MKKILLKEATTTGSSGKFRIPMNLAPQLWDNNQLSPFNVPVSDYISPENAYDSYDGHMDRSESDISRSEKKFRKMAKLGKSNFSQNDDEGNPLNGISPLGSTEPGTPKNLREIILNRVRLLSESDEMDEDLAVWFGKKKKPKGSSQPQGPWVNICRKTKSGGHPPCGRDEADTKAYPKCRAKGVASRMSDEEKQAACRQKRAKEKKNPKHGKGNTPTMAKYEKRENVQLNKRPLIESEELLNIDKLCDIIFTHIFKPPFTVGKKPESYGRYEGDSAESFRIFNSKYNVVGVIYGHGKFLIVDRSISDNLKLKWKSILRISDLTFQDMDIIEFHLRKWLRRYPSFENLEKVNLGIPW